MRALERRPDVSRRFHLFDKAMQVICGIAASPHDAHGLAYLLKMIGHHREVRIAPRITVEELPDARRGVESVAAEALQRLGRARVANQCRMLQGARQIEVVGGTAGDRDPDPVMIDIGHAFER
jgi:hypothetical protein